MYLYRFFVVAIVIIAMVTPLNVVQAGGDDNLITITSVPREMSYQGILRDSGGDPVEDSVYNITFRIYNLSSGGSSLWDETLPCTTTAGVFTSTFSSVDLPFDEDYWLELEIDTEILDPRQKMTMVGYSAVSDTADYAQRVATVDGATGGTISGDVSIQSNLSVDGNIDATGKATIGPGHTNSGTSAFVAGENNTASGEQSTVGGGSNNTAGDSSATVGGGYNNSATAKYSVIAGGARNEASEYHSVVTGGADNIASGAVSFVGGGQEDSATGSHSVVSGGYLNTASGDYSTVAGGQHNIANNNYSTVGGGSGNTAGDSSTVCGGINNTASNEYASVVCGGVNNEAYRRYSFIGGGLGNFTQWEYSVIGGGLSNSTGGARCVVAGGESNEASGPIGWAAVGGGFSNTASGDYSAVGGGQSNTASAPAAAIGGGSSNTASGDASVVAGGYAGLASGENATIGGGWHNLSSGSVSTVAGGQEDTASGIYATVPGGYRNSASGTYSFAAGNSAKANHGGTFVWGDATVGNFASTGNNQFLIRASGGVGIGTNNPTSALHVNGEAKCEVGGVTFYMVPQGAIIMWSGTLASIPAGWALCDGTNGTPNLSDRFIYSVHAGENPGATGGSATIPAHSHSVDIPPFNTSSTGWTWYGANAGLSQLADYRHTHSVDPPPTNTNTQPAASNIPPYYKLAFIMKL